MQAFPQGEPGSPTVAGAPEVLTVPPAANTEPLVGGTGQGALQGAGTGALRSQSAA